jgi:hypothetical protein
MEETKWLKPSVSVSRIGDSASVQAVTRVNVEQSTFQTQSPQRETMQSFDMGDRGAWLQLGQPETARASDMAPCARNRILMASSCIQRS